MKLMVFYAIIKIITHRKYRNVQRSYLQSFHSKTTFLTFGIFSRPFYEQVCVCVFRCLELTICFHNFLFFFPFTFLPKQPMGTLKYFTSPQKLLYKSFLIFTLSVCSEGWTCFQFLIPKVQPAPASECTPGPLHVSPASDVSLEPRNACWLLHQLLQGHLG